MCLVCDREEDLSILQFKFWDDNYCSLYCQLFDEQKLTKYRPSTNSHTRHFEYYPPIIQSCEGCGKEMKLRWGAAYANRQFCGKRCNNKKGPRKRSRKSYFPLKIIKHSFRPMAANQFISRLDGQRGIRYTTAAVAQILRNYALKGIVEIHGENPCAYSMTDWAKQKPLKELLI